MSCQAESKESRTDAGKPFTLPPSIEVAWGLRDRPHKGPKPGLSLARIVDAAVRVADAEGLQAVSMGRVAAELGAAPMSLYRHVASKDELTALMVDAAYGEPPGLPADGAGWRDWLSQWAWALRAAMYRHPWTLRVPVSGLPVLPNEVAWFERGLASLGGTGLPEAQKASVILLLSGYVRNEATVSADIIEAVRASGGGPHEWMSAYKGLLARVAEPHRFPAISKLVAAGVFDVFDAPDDEFIFGLDRVLDGIGQLIAG